MARLAAQKFRQLRRGQLGPARRRRVAPARRPFLAAHWRRRFGQAPFGRARCQRLCGVSVTPEVSVLADAAAITRHAAERLLDAAQAAAVSKNSFSLVLSGGSTPKTLYALLAGDPMLRA